LQGYADVDWDGSVMDRKSTFGCCFSLGSSMISWFSSKKTYVILCTAKEEYITMCLACIEAVWLRNLLVGIFDLDLEKTCIFCDN
jgi:hypothetical protein